MLFRSAINKSGKIIGYAVSALDLKSLYEDVVSGLDIQDSAVYILDKKGAPIYATDHVNSPEPLIPSKVLKELVANKENAQVLSRNDASDLVGAIREIPGLGWYVGVFKKEEDRESAIISMAATNSADWRTPARVSLNRAASTGDLRRLIGGLLKSRKAPKGLSGSHLDRGVGKP